MTPDSMLFTLLSTGAALVALVVATRVSWRLHTQQTLPRRKLHELELEVLEVCYQIEQIKKVLTRATARDNMARARERKRELHDEQLPLPIEEVPEIPGGANSVSDELARRPDEDEVTWKRRARVVLASRN